MASQIIERPVEQMDALTLPELAEQANEAAGDVDGYASATVESAVRCGMLLLTAKGKVKHGQWQAWLETSFHKTAKQARIYMQLAKRTRECVLDDSNSIRDAMRRIAGPKEGSEEHREEQIADMLRGGASQVDVVEKFHCQHITVKRIYEEIVMPELLETDWRTAVNKALVKPIAAVELWPVIQAEYRHIGASGGCYEWVASEINVSVGLLTHAAKVIRDGIPQLISRAKAGDIALSTACELAKLPADQQAKELATRDRKKTVDIVDDLRSRVSTMLDQKLGWNSQYGPDDDVFRDLGEIADQADISEIVRNLLLVRDWVAAIATLLEGKPCSRQMNGQQHS